MGRSFMLVLLLPAVLAACVRTDGASDKDGPDLADDKDRDGFGTDEDCDDNDPSAYPDAPELCDGLDNDCDLDIDEGATESYYPDGDDDGAGTDSDRVQACDPPAGYAKNKGDCDDNDDEVRPGLPERCDGKDNDCDGTIDEDAELINWYRDADGDGYGDPTDILFECVGPEGYVENSLDCDDTSYLEPVHVAEGGLSLPDTGETGVWTDTAFGTLPGGAANPLGSIQEGIDLANLCVLVHPGEYPENIDFHGKNILVQGVDGAADTTIRAAGPGPTVTFASGEAASAELRGFTVTGGTGSLTSTTVTEDCGYRATCTIYSDTWRGGGILVDGAGPTLSNLVVSENTLRPYSYTELSSTEYLYVYSMGGGAYVTEGTPIILDSLFIDNRADEGGGLWLDAASTVNAEHTVFAQNRASSGGGVASFGSLTMVASVFALNEAATAGGGYGGAALTVGSGRSALTNVTLFANVSTGGSVYLASGGRLLLSNSIAVTNSAGSILDGEAGASLTVTYSDVFDGTGGDWGSFSDGTGTMGNIGEDPRFVTAVSTWSASDLHLRPGSPAIDAADPAAFFNDVDGSRGDMGAYGGPEGGW